MYNWLEDQMVYNQSNKIFWDKILFILYFVKVALKRSFYDHL